jgi:hypothetical protein
MFDLILNIVIVYLFIGFFMSLFMTPVLLNIRSVFNLGGSVSLSETIKTFIQVWLKYPLFIKSIIDSDDFLN